MNRPPVNLPICKVRTLWHPLRDKYPVPLIDHQFLMLAIYIPYRNALHVAYVNIHYQQSLIPGLLTVSGSADPD